jgi:hypothetical protein
LIEKCAENGTWVLISTLKFPSFWYTISRKLEKMHEQGRILNTFRLFFDLQGYSLQEIPENFLFNHAVKFYLTDRNNEDMEGFNDIWANILNDDILNAKELNDVNVLEVPSELHKINLNIESNIYDNSMESLLPEGRHAGGKKVHEDIIKYSVTDSDILDSRNTILLPEIMGDDRHGQHDQYEYQDEEDSSQDMRRGDYQKYDAPQPKTGNSVVPNEIAHNTTDLSAIGRDSRIVGAGFSQSSLLGGLEFSKGENTLLRGKASFINL